MRENALESLDSGRFVLLQEVLDGVSDLPVSDTGLDGSESDLGGLVRGLDEVGLGARNRIGTDNDADGFTSIFSVRTPVSSPVCKTLDSRLTGNDGVTIDVGSDDDLDNVLRLEGLSSTFLVTRDGRESLDHVVDRDGGRVSDT